MQQSIFSDDNDPFSQSSMPTLRGGGASNPGEPVIGRIDQYDILRKLGGGGFGVVYLARDSVSGVEVALKTLHPLLKTNAEEMEQLREKFRLVHCLTHPNIAKALVLHPCQRVDVWDEAARRELRLSPGDYVMVMDYAPGVTLSKWRRQFSGGIVPPEQALEVARQVAAALDYAHGERIVHRDIKPGNVMVETIGSASAAASPPALAAGRPAAPESQAGEPPLVSRLPSPVTSRIRARILDFGLAAEIRSSMSRVSTEQGDTSGTRPYMAPEQWLGRKQDGRTDQYALACVLYELLSGAPPFAGVFETGDPIIMRTAVERDAPEEIEGLPAAMNAALLRALAKNPKERFPTCADFIATFASTSNPESHNPCVDPTDAGGPRQFFSSTAESRAVSGTTLSISGDDISLPVELTVDSRMDVGSGTVSFSSSSGHAYSGSSSIIHAEWSGDKGVDITLPGTTVAGKKVKPHAAKGGASRPGEPPRRSILPWVVVAALAVLGGAGIIPYLLSRSSAIPRVPPAAVVSSTPSAQSLPELPSSVASLKELREARERFRNELKSRRDAGLPDSSKESMTLLAGIAKLDERITMAGAERAAAERKAKEEAERLVRERAEAERTANEAAAAKTAGRAGELETVSIGTQTIRLRWCPAGSFTMGSPASEDGRDIDETQHRVTLTKGFWMGETEVTQGLWKEVTGGSNPSYFRSGDDYPVENVSWDDCQDFLRKLNAKAPSGWRFALPTEAQWEYACRAGTATALPNGKDITIRGVNNAPALDDIAWYGGNSSVDWQGVNGYDCSGWSEKQYSGSKAGTHPVGKKKPNDWGLYDMIGNVCEWCADWYGDYPSGAVSDPPGPSKGSYRVRRGGSWFNHARSCRSAIRGNNDPGRHFNFLGFRVALVQVQ